MPTFLPPLASPILAALSTLYGSLATPGKNAELSFPSPVGLSDSRQKYVHARWERKQLTMKSEVARKCNDKATCLLFFHPKEAWFYWPLPFYWLLPTTQALNENSSSTTIIFIGLLISDSDQYNFLQDSGNFTPDSPPDYSMKSRFILGDFKRKAIWAGVVAQR